MHFVYKGLQTYAKSMWMDFRKNVLHKEEKGHRDIWHMMTTYLVMIPFDIIFAVIGFTALLAGILAIVPIARLFGYDLGPKFARKQAALQAKMKPGLWVPLIGKLHSARQRWNSVQPAEQVFRDTLAAARRLEARNPNDEECQIVETDQKNMRLKMHFFTKKMKFLDVVDLKVDVGPDLGGSVIEACSYSTGVAPLILPPYVAVFLSAIGFWIPFSDWGLNSRRLDRLRTMAKVELEVEKDKAG